MSCILEDGLIVDANVGRQCRVLVGLGLEVVDATRLLDDVEDRLTKAPRAAHHRGELGALLELTADEHLGGGDVVGKVGLFHRLDEQLEIAYALVDIRAELLDELPLLDPLLVAVLDRAAELGGQLRRVDAFVQLAERLANLKLHYAPATTKN